MSTWEPISATLLSIGSLVQAILAEKRNQVDGNRKQAEEIKIAISAAFHSTERYYALRQAGKPQDDGIEFEIAQQWETAAILIEPLDQNLANRLSLKSRFWREGGIWSDEEIRDAGIQLSRVRAEGMTIFSETKN